MTTYNNAQAGNAALSIQYDIDQLTADVKTDGNQAWRHNNVSLLPLNISARNNNALGSAFGVAIFPDKATSQQAFKSECARPKYAGFTLGEMINTFIPDYIIEPPTWNEEKNAPVLPWLEPTTGLDVNAELTDYAALLNLVETHIGWQVGTTETLEKDTEAKAPNVSTVSGNNVLINGKTAVHKGSGGTLQTIDICLTKIGPATVPIPYANIAKSSDASGTAGSVKINGNPACHIKSNFSKSAGDAPGKKKGLISGTLEDKAEFLSSSSNVFMEGKPAVRQGDLMVSNAKNTAPMPLSQSGGAKPKGLKVKDKAALEGKQGARQIIIKIAGNEKLDTDIIVKG